MRNLTPRNACSIILVLAAVGAYFAGSWRQPVISLPFGLGDVVFFLLCAFWAHESSEDVERAKLDAENERRLEALELENAKLVAGAALDFVETVRNRLIAILSEERGAIGETPAAETILILDRLRLVSENLHVGIDRGELGDRLELETRERITESFENALRDVIRGNEKKEGVERIAIMIDDALEALAGDDVA
jgi:hypothetical protein